LSGLSGFYESRESKGDGAITKRQAEIERDKYLAKLNAATVEVAVEQAAVTGVALLGEVAEMYKEGYLGRKDQIVKPTREKEELYLLVDHARRPRHHEPHLPLRRRPRIVGGGQA
jgi:hypothetical protein